MAERAERFIAHYPSLEDDHLNAYGLREVSGDPSKRRAALQAKLFSRCGDTGDYSVQASDGPTAARKIALEQGRCRRRLLEASKLSTVELASSSGASELEGTSSSSSSFSSRDESTVNSSSTGSSSSWLVNESEVHWHVFDFNLLLELLEGCMGYQLRWVDFQEPYHQIVLFQKKGV